MPVLSKSLHLAAASSVTKTTTIIAMNFTTLCRAFKSDLDVQQNRAGFKQKLTLNYSLKCDQNNNNNCHEFYHTLLCCLNLTKMFSKIEPVLSKSSHLAAVSSVTKTTIMMAMNLTTLCFAA